MYGFIDELSKLCGVPINEAINEYKVVLLGSSLLCVYGFQKIITYDHDRVVLKVKDGRVVVSGENITIAVLDQGYIAVKGKISSVQKEG